MPRVRLLASGAGRYDVSKGQLFVCTDEELSRWLAAGIVELADGEDEQETVEVPEVEVPEVEVEAAAVPEVEVAPVTRAAPKTTPKTSATQRRSRRKTSG